MSDKMRQIPFGQLMAWVLDEYESNETIFGIHKQCDQSIKGNYNIFGSKLDLPLGPAAGPHTQLAQNLIASYVAGARFFELKTVQVLDGEDLPVSKPCIEASDEGYNVEWSTELYVPQALDEYIKGWFAIKLLSRELGLGDGVVFNMSVGYDLEGIRTAKIDSFIEGLKNAEQTDSWKACKEWAKCNVKRFKHINESYIDEISPNISNSITLSTLHGCPPEEIKRIAMYMMNEKELHTYVKCNPTLLGYEYARKTLDKLGFDYISFDDRHFKTDLQFNDAVPMLRRLQTLANNLSLEFGVKLTNTFPVQITNNELPGEEMYMSGRSLFSLSIEVANRLSKAFDGNLRISFSGGADVRNIAQIFETGIWPITIATTLLKPGGYQRLGQVAEALSKAVFDSEKSELINKNQKISLQKLDKLILEMFNDEMYKKPPGLPPMRKIDEKVPLIDCFTAPCQNGCPFGQDVPAYLRLTAEGKYTEAMRVITEKNPLPNITGEICSHNCMNKCIRFYYEKSVDIREAKKTATVSAFSEILTDIKTSPSIPKTEKKTAIVGGGPAGLAAAYFLAREGYPVTIFEERDSLGGIVRHVIPEFRIENNLINSDIDLVLAMGAEVKLNTKISNLSQLQDDGYDYIIIATGAWVSEKLELKEGSAIDALTFLEELKKSSQTMDIGKNVVVVGGGNTAMDTARAALRIDGVENVKLVYRRTKRYMPADPEEYEITLKEGVEFVELAAPVSLENGILTCNRMKLSDSDTSGRRKPIPTGDTFVISADTVIEAVGYKTDRSLFENQDVYVIGDANRGAATVAEAIADAANCAAEIAGVSYGKYYDLNFRDNVYIAQKKKGIICCNDSETGNPELCLECPTVCNLCVEVCPNRANINISIDGRPQILHIDSMCNECGNCAVFCPYDSAPYLDKLTYYNCEDDFKASKNPGFFELEDGVIRTRLGGEISDHRDGAKLPKDIWQLVNAALNYLLPLS